MKARHLHPWDVSPAEAVRIQEDLAGQVIRRNQLGPVRYIAGVDLSVAYGTRQARVAVVVLDYPLLTVRDSVVLETAVTFPYVPGLLSFRETPAVLAAFERLSFAPDLVIVDGQGVAHPRRLGYASHVGLLLDTPTIGCAKSRLVGEYVEPGPNAGDWTELVDAGELIGAVLRTKRGSRPLFVSIGHKLDLATCREWVMRCGKGYRLPEPSRLAHLLAGGKLKSNHKGVIS